MIECLFDKMKWGECSFNAWCDDMSEIWSPASCGPASWRLYSVTQVVYTPKIYLKGGLFML
jgi:hypothetical protein